MDRRFMEQAIALAKEAFNNGEVPVGCVIVKDGEIIARAKNDREATANALGHAEIRAIDMACRRLNSWRLDGCTLYVTLEPCPMCAGAIINARIPTVVYGAFDNVMGSFESKTDLSKTGFPFAPEIYAGICEKECTALLTDFFKTLR